jgi:hypothetical protein
VQLLSADIDSDIAVVDSTELERKYPSGYNAAQSLPMADQVLTVYGYPEGLLKPLRTTLQVRRPALVQLSDLLSEKLIGDLGQRGSPVTPLQVLSIQGNILPGHSGSPIFAQDGSVVGIADGGLKDGTVAISWAIPIGMLQRTRAVEGNPRLQTLIHYDSSLLFDLPSIEEQRPPGQLLSEAAGNGDTEAVRRILAVNPPQADKDWALVSAVRYDQPATTELLLQFRAVPRNDLLCLATQDRLVNAMRVLANYQNYFNPNAVCNNSHPSAPPLSLALWQWDIDHQDTRDVVKVLLTFRNIDPNVAYKGNSALHSAVDIGDTELVTDLLRFKGLQINATDGLNQTAADLACVKHRTSILRILVSHGAKGVSHDSKEIKKCAATGYSY